MPNPKSKITSEDINVQFYRLSMIDTVSSNGYIYRLDFEEHESNIQYARQQYNEDKLAFEEGNITSQEYQTSHEMYMDCIDKYTIIDEDRKICGEYSAKEKSYKIYYWRFMTEGRVYYCDENRAVWTYTNSYIGELSYDMEIIRDFQTLDVDSESDDDSENDSDYEEID